MHTIIDTHCHLYAEEFDTDRAEAIDRAIQAGVERILLPNIDADSIGPMYSLCDAYPDLCIPMMGLHPTSVKEDYLQVLKRIEEELDKRPFIAIGEIGLDYYWDTTFKAEQQDAFRKQLKWARERQLPVAIHTRDSFADALEIVRQEKESGPLSGVFHCFGGTREEAEAVMALETFYMGIGGVVTFKKAGLDLTLPHVPMDYLILETDAPYLAPVPHRGKRNEPSYLTGVVKRLSEIKQVSEDEIRQQTTENASRLFRL